MYTCGLNHYHELPYKTLVEDRLHALLNANDPGLFVCSLPGEFAAMNHALVYDKTMSHHKLFSWLNERLVDAQQRTFLGNHVPIWLVDLRGIFDYDNDQTP